MLSMMAESTQIDLLDKPAVMWIIVIVNKKK